MNKGIIIELLARPIDTALGKGFTGSTAGYGFRITTPGDR
jgi:hypothetical protein